MKFSVYFMNFFIEAVFRGETHIYN